MMEERSESFFEDYSKDELDLEKYKVSKWKWKITLYYFN